MRAFIYERDKKVYAWPHWFFFQTKTRALRNNKILIAFNLPSQIHLVLRNCSDLFGIPACF
jgi:hypothetical protein